MSNNLAVLNYTNKDFESLKADLISKVPSLAPYWTNLNEGDLGMALLNMVAGVGDMLAYYIDRGAEEVYLPTARARASVMRIARLIDYRLSRPVAARTKLRFSIEAPVGHNILIPAYTVARTKKNVYFTTKKNATLFAGNTSVDVEAFQGELVTDTFPATGADDQSYTLSRSNVAQNFLDVRVAGGLWIEDTREIDFVDSGVYVVDSDVNNVATLKFSTHLGNVPGQNSTIEAHYIKTKGDRGNIGSGLVTVLVSEFTNSQTLSVTNPEPASGGQAAESTESARIKAPRYLRTMNRAVTLQDFVDILELLDGVAKARAINHHGYVEIFVAPDAATQFFVPLPTFSLLKGADANSTLAAGTYYVRVTAVDAHGETADWEYTNQVNDATDPTKDTREVVVNEKNITIASGEALVIQIANVTGATKYRVYVGTTSGEVRFSKEVAAEADGLTYAGVLSLPAADAATPPLRNTTGARAADGFTSLKVQAEDALELRRLVGSVFALYNPTYVPVDVTATVKIYANYYQQEVRGRVRTALREFFDFDHQEFGATVGLASLYQTIMEVEGVRSVSFTLPSDDIVLGKGEIATDGTFALTMEGGIS